MARQAQATRSAPAMPFRTAPAEPQAATPTGSNVRRLRLWKRRPVHLQATLGTPEGAHLIAVCDISRFGAGLYGVEAVAREQTVTLDFGNGRIIAARMRWRIGMRAGIAFDQPLAESDPLLRGDPHSSPLAAAALRQSVPDMRMLARACREQGFAWLTDFDDE